MSCEENYIALRSYLRVVNYPPDKYYIKLTKKKQDFVILIRSKLAIKKKKKKKFAINLMSELSTHSRNQSVNKSFALQYNTKQVGVLLGNITKQNSYMARNLNTCNETC